MVVIDTDLEAVLKKFRHVELEDSSGIVAVPFARDIARFKHVRFICPSVIESVDAPQRLYDDSLVVHDFLTAQPVIIPRIGDTHVYSRRLKTSEEIQAGFPARLSNGLIAGERGIHTPRIIAHFSVPNVSYCITEYCGAQNLMSALKNGLRTQGVEEQKMLSAQLRHFRSEYRRLDKKYGWLPALNQLSDEFIDVIDGIHKKYKFGKGNVPRWAFALACFLEQGEMLHARKDLLHYLNICRMETQAERSLREPKGTFEHEKLEEVCVGVGRRLRQNSEKGVLLLDVAPRDIVIDAQQQPWFVDMENVVFYDRPLDKHQQKKQLCQVKSEFPPGFRNRSRLLKCIEKGYYE